MKRWRWVMVPLVFIGTVIFAMSIYSAEESFSENGEKAGIAFVSGGIAHKEREILEQMGKEYTLKLVFSNKKGQYLSDVIVKICDPKGDSVLTTVSIGPWLFVDLPSGIYNLEATSRTDRKKVSEIQVEEGSQKVIAIQLEI
jgi:hypothetical protein